MITIFAIIKQPQDLVDKNTFKLSFDVLEPTAKNAVNSQQQNLKIWICLFFLFKNHHMHWKNVVH